ncbi:MAG: hypothetical protein U5O39_01740 [Gammaproteobacteria bacterium]|nr:hypothetical protein [Gammaproteobacteria bacterium]
MNAEAFGHNDQIGKADLAHRMTKAASMSPGSGAIPWVTTIRVLMNGGRSFEPVRSLASDHLQGVEVEPSIAARGQRITIAWHAGEMTEEESRQVFAIDSSDRGETFGEVIAVSDQDLGVCACCAMASMFDDKGD